ncbi:MAG: hypothetical protein L6Q33_00740 [Bacteriovoracaceae bacterium]|nr:hypothetical protein [Bacteriovoracaceae bacterium]
MLYVLRAFFIAILSGSLLLFDFSYKGIETKKVYAEEIKDSNMFATLAMSATGLIASRLFTYPKLTPDMMAAAVGGAAFIAGEIAAYAQFREQLKDFEMEIVRDDKGNIDNKQIETIEKLLQSYEKGKDTAKTKKTLQMAAAAAFAVAAGIAAFTTGTDEAALTACKTAITTAETAAASCLAAASAETLCPNPYCNWASYALYQAACPKCAADVQGILTNHLAVVMGRETPGPNMGFFTKVLTTKKTMDTLTGQACLGVPNTTAAAVASAKAACPSANQTTTMMEAGGGPQLTWFAQQQMSPYNQKLIAFILSSFLVPQAHASTFSSPLSMMGIASSTAVAFVMANYLGVANMVDMNLLIAKRRMIIWAAMAATTMMAAQATDNVIQKIESNIQKIKNILQRMYELHPGSFASKPQLVDALKGKLTPIKKLTEVAINNVDANGKKIEGTTGKLPCVFGDSSGKCADVEAAMQKMDGFNSLPAELKNETKGVMDLGKALNGADKINSGALDAAGKLADKANALSERAKNQRKKLQEVLNARKDVNGKSQNYDFDKNTNDMKASLLKNIEDNMKKKGLTNASVAQMFGSDMNALAALSNKGELDGKNKNNKGNVVDLSGAANAKPVEDPNKDLSNIDLAAEDVAGISADELADAAGSTAETKDMTEEYDLSSNVHTDPEVNIFDIISKRYMSTGYKRLLQRKNMK